MTPAEIIAKALLDTDTHSSNFDPDTVGIEALNIVYDEVNNFIVENVKEDYFWDKFLVSTVDLQSEYNISSATLTWDSTPDTEVNIKKVNKVFVKFDSTQTYFTPLKYIAPDTLEKDFDEYAATQSKTDPFFFVQDRSIFIFPYASPAVTSWLKMNAIYSPPKVLIDSPESWFSIQKDKHYIISIGIEEHIYKSQWKANEAINSRRRFDMQLTKLWAFLKSRVNTAKSKTMWDLSDYS